MPTIAKTEAKAWHETYLSLFPKSIHSSLRSVDGSVSDSSFSPNFSPAPAQESASVCVNYLRSIFLRYRSNALRSRTRGHLSELRWGSFPEGSHFFFCSSLTFNKFLAVAENLFHCYPTRQSILPMLYHLVGSSMDHLLYIFCLTWPLHSFLSIWKSSTIISTHKIRKPVNSPASFRPISLISCISKQYHSIPSIILSEVSALFSIRLGWFLP